MPSAKTHVASTEKEIGRECRFAWHIPTRDSQTPDLHFVKEQIHYEDESGTRRTQPNLRFVKDFKRPFWVTKKHLRNYEQKREYTSVEELNRFECTQSELRSSVARAIGEAWRKDPIKKLSASPYLYGSDISSSSLLKAHYMEKYPKLVSGHSVAVLDIETDVVHGTEDPIACSVLYKNEAFLSIDKKFIRGLHDIQGRVQDAARKYIGEYLDKHGMKITIHLADDPGDMFDACFKKLHKWMPDLLAIWNVNFDIPKINAALKKYNRDPKEILCAPEVPYQHRLCEYKPGPTKRVSAAGKVFPINPAAQWHTFELTASFYIIDAMCAYKHLRLGDQEEPSYALDAILSKRLGIRKLKFEEAKDYEDLGLKWHQFMQSNYKVEYLVYNIFDCLSMLELDEKIKDLSYTLPAFSVTTDFWYFKSQPRRIADALHYFALENDYVMGTVGPSEKQAVTADVDDEDPFADASDDGDEDADEEKKQDVLGVEGWIITLPAHNMALGLPLIAEDRFVHTLFRAYVYDSDSVSSYPTCTSICNVSMTTTKRELISIEGIDEQDFRMQNLNMVIGATNAVEYCYSMFGAPDPASLLNDFMSDVG